jgi:hypothetical protein
MRMSSLMYRLFLIVMLLAGSARAAETSLTAKPWATAQWTTEAGILWEVGTGTPWPYRLVEGQLVWRSRQVFGWDLKDGSRILVRHRLALIGALMQQGPESHYVAFSGSPSLEWWNAAGTSALFGGAGGGFGLLDAQGVRGGQGQDFTLNWFMRGGIEHVTAGGRHVSAAIMFQHMSNGGATKPNPGIDALGLMLGWTW